MFVKINIYNFKKTFTIKNYHVLQQSTALPHMQVKLQISKSITVNNSNMFKKKKKNTIKTTS